MSDILGHATAPQLPLCATNFTIIIAEKALVEAWPGTRGVQALFATVIGRLAEAGQHRICPIHASQAPCPRSRPSPQRAPDQNRNTASISHLRLACCLHTAGESLDPYWSCCTRNGKSEPTLASYIHVSWASLQAQNTFVSFLFALCVSPRNCLF
jgi:hypothetical protein